MNCRQATVWVSELNKIIDHWDDSLLDVSTLVQKPELLTPDVVETIISLVEEERLSMQKAAALVGAALLLAPEFGSLVPLSFLDRCRLTPSMKLEWKSLALLRLHSNRSAETSDWLQSMWKDGGTADGASVLLQHLCDWFPERVRKDVVETLCRRNGYLPEFIAVLEFINYRNGEADRADFDGDGPLVRVLGTAPQILVVHNIDDGQGDEMLRVYGLVQALLDKFSELEITLFTDRSYLYEHPRIRLFDVHDAAEFREKLAQKWHGIIEFFEPYRPESSYNQEMHDQIEDRFQQDLPPFIVRARKDWNTFVFDTVVMDQHEYATKFGVGKRLLPLNYEICMRLISCLGLPLRTGEDSPLAGFIQTSINRPDIEETWQVLTKKFTDANRRIVVANIWGGQAPLKGFTESDSKRLSVIFERLVEEGYGIVLVTIGEQWGNAVTTDAILNLLKPELRSHIVVAPHLQNRQENMRQNKYFAAWSDLLVTVEGWMMHLAYALGKPFRLLMAPNSAFSEWHPHGRTAHQAIWYFPNRSERRSEFVISDTAEVVPVLHYPEKSLLSAAFQLWAPQSRDKVDKVFKYWSRSQDRDIAKWSTEALLNDARIQ